MTPIFGYAAATSRGPIRPNNEDAVAAGCTILIGEDATPASVLIDPAAKPLFTVADGMGGHPCGSVASSLVVSQLALDPPDPTEASCAAAVRRTNLQLHAAMELRPETLGMGAVMAGVVICGSSACWFNVGDCRVYHSLSNGRLLQLSVDDVTASASPGRRSTVVSVALGGRRSIAPVEPHTGSIVLATEDRLILCSDGVTAALGDGAIATILAAATTPVTAVRQLIAACNEQMARDNISVIVIGQAER